MKVLPRCGLQTSSLGQKYKFMGPACTAESASLGMGPGNAFHPTPLPPPPLVHSGLRTVLKPCIYCPGSTWHLWVRDIRWPLLLLIPAAPGQETALYGSPGGRTSGRAREHLPFTFPFPRGRLSCLKGVALRHLPLLRMQKGAPRQTLLSPAPILQPVFPSSSHLALPRPPDRESRGGR